jgi:hypothetical protein
MATYFAVFTIIFGISRGLYNQAFANQNVKKEVDKRMRRHFDKNGPMSENRNEEYKSNELNAFIQGD